MSRPIDEYVVAQDDLGSEDRTDRWASRSTARAFAAAVSAFAISAFVITTSSNALEPRGTVAGTSFTSGTIELSDDDEDRALFDLGNMRPNRPSSECIRVVYQGTLLPVDLTLSAAVAGDLAPYLRVRIEQGTGAGFGDCTGFEQEATVFDGTMAEMGDAGRLTLGQFLNETDSMSFRFHFEMADEQAAVGRTSTVEFAWEAAPS